RVYRPTCRHVPKTDDPSSRGELFAVRRKRQLADSGAATLLQLSPSDHVPDFHSGMTGDGEGSPVGRESTVPRPFGKLAGHLSRLRIPDLYTILRRCNREHVAAW